MPRRADKVQKRPGGNGGKRYPLNMRTTFEIREKLEGAAAASGRSLAQEAEFRIDRTFAEERSLTEALDLAYGRELAGIVIVVAEAMKLAGQAAGHKASRTLEGALNWWKSPYAFAQACAAAFAVLDAFKPSGKIVVPVEPEPLNTVGDAFPFDVDNANSVGIGASNTILEEASAGFTRSSASVDRARRLHRAVSALAERIERFADPEFRDAKTHIGDDQ